MKLCAACNQELPKGNFSKKQWQLKQYRRCKSCIADNREVNLETPLNHVPSLPGANGECSNIISAEKKNDVIGMMRKCEISSKSCHKNEDLFKKPPPRDDCPICMLLLPLESDTIQYQACCGKVLCMGCIYAVVQGDCRTVCPFCRAIPNTSDEELVERIKKRSESDDAIAMNQLGNYYDDGRRGLPQNYDRAMELWLRAGELGCAMAYNNIANAYYTGEGVEQDETKAKHYYELAAMGGYAKARHNLGVIEYNSGNFSRAVNHLMISAGAGSDESLADIRRCFLNGHATKADFEKALRTHKEATDHMSSEQRGEAAAFLRSLHASC